MFHASAIRFQRRHLTFAVLLLLDALALSLAAPHAPTQEIKVVQVPDVWKNAPGNGVFWYRAWIDVPAEWRGRPAELFVEPADDAREIFVNGRSIGRAGDFPPRYRSGLGDNETFPVPPDTLRAGEKNVVAIRVFQDLERRTGFNVAAPVLFAGDDAIRLQGGWQVKPSADDKWGAAADINPPPADLTFSKVAAAVDVRRTLKKLAGEEGPLSPTDAVTRFKTPDDLEVELVLAEPIVGQPLSLTWDERGRLWVCQYRQYPNPAGLKMVSRDKFLRSVYDKVPPPPPNHFRGEDRITIHEDSDGDGRLDRHKIFVDGLNLATSCAPGAGGVWVLNPPYLLFYPDRNHDDVPDGDPEVHLEGFGLEDSHSIANSLRWGPDGWLYAAQGSTVSADIRRPGSKDPVVHSMGQLIWRYHPASRRYEIFAEGGGNTFGVEIDAKGRIFSGHNGGDTRGFHYVQGGYSQKGFGKHGSLSNPYAFGYFAQMAHHSVARFTHTFVIYESGALPAAYHGKLFGVEPLQGRVVFSDFQPDRSSFKTKDLGHALTTSDTWFRPVDIKVGPEGAIYVADMYEQKIDHASHYQGRVDKNSGRIYRLKAKGAPSAKLVNLAAKSPAELLDVLRSENKERRQAALRLIADRNDSALAPVLRDALPKQSGQAAVEFLWALNLLGGLDESEALKLLAHDDPYVRLWTVRLMCDDGQVSPRLRDRFADLAYRDPSVEVRSQLACSARRLPFADAAPILKNLVARNEDAADIHVPLLLWWAIEAHAEASRDNVVAFFQDPNLWQLPLVRDNLLEKVMRRYAMPGARKDLLACAKLLDQAPDAESKKRLMKGFEDAYQGRSLAGLPPELVQAIAKAGGASLPLRLRQSEPAAIDEALKTVADEKADAKQRLQLVEILGQVRQPRSIDPLLAIVADSKNESLRRAAITALQGYDDARIGAALIKQLTAFNAETRGIAESVLASRKSWTLELLKSVQAGQPPRESFPPTAVKKLLLRPDDQVAAQVRQIWGEVQGATTAEMRASIERLAQVIDAGTGNPYNGKQLYNASCGKCHRLFEDGGRIGPDLTSYKRDDLRRMLLNVVNPSAEIREGFENHVAVTTDGRTINGFVVDQDAQVVTLRNAEGQTVLIPRDDLDELKAIPVSLMPEGLLKDLSEQQVRDLFAYLRATQPLP